MGEQQKKREPAIRLVAVSGIFGLLAVAFLGFGVFGIKLIAAMMAMPAPGAAPVTGEVAAPPAQGKTVEPAAARTEAGAPEAVATVETRKLLEVGRSVYMQCAACHGPAGKSLIPGMAPDLAGSSIANGPAERVMAVVLNGIMPEGRFQGVMVPWKAMLTDEQIAGVLTFVRSSFGNKAETIVPEVVARARTQYAGQVNPMKRSELEAITGEQPPG